MVEFRPFHNTDPPRLTELWNFSRLGPGAVQEVSNDLFDMLVLSEPYFDREGLIVAADGSEIIGLVHAGFGANPQGSALDYGAGVIGAVLVRTDRRREGIGRELVARAEGYLRGRGARAVFGGEAPRRDPFYLGLYGSSECVGFLDSDTAAAPFFAAMGYVPCERWIVMRRDIGQSKEPFDPRCLQIKRTMKFGVFDKPPRADWWWMTRHGRFDSLTFVLVPNSGGLPPAQVTCWNMELHALTRGQRTVGMTDLFTDEASRRKGYARVLLGEVLRRLREDGVTHVEAVAREENSPALGLLGGLGFERADAGVVFRRSLDNTA